MKQEEERAGGLEAVQLDPTRQTIQRWLPWIWVGVG